MIETKYMSATKVAQKYGLTKRFVLEACRSEVGYRFSTPSKIDEDGNCVGKWYINCDRFEEAMNNGLLTKGG